MLSEASIHSNTAGVFKGFYKNRRTKIGQFGGTGSDALLRIRGSISLNPPVLSNFECAYQVLQQDANAATRQICGLDLAYLDPPYNQHPYGSNYFMLNLIAEYKWPKHTSKVSGIQTNWNRSGYNIRSESLRLMTDLVQNVDAPFLLISFNDEGFILLVEMESMLSKVGSVEVIEIPYNAFRGSRNFKNRSIHVTEHLFWLRKDNPIWHENINFANSALAR
ncbi:MAG: Modification methylase FokI [Verrucomicrobia subdivision 3 bacterium]|nr:Modification methylase FokI [Limisphaerales bacterium]